MRRLGLALLLLALVGCQDRIPDDPSAPDQGLLQSGATAEQDVFACPTCVFDHACTHLRRDSVAMVHEGKRYHFCKAQCVADFREDPAKFVAALDRHLAAQSVGLAEG